MSKKAIVSADEVIQKREPPQIGEVWGPKEWYPSKAEKPLNEQIKKFVLAKMKNADEFHSYYDKECKPDIDAEFKKRAEEQKRLRIEFAEKQRVDNLPENKIPALFMGKGAYPQSFEQATKQFSLKDFRMVRDLALVGKLDTKLGISKHDFILWCTGVIDTKCAEQAPVTNKEEKSALDKLKDVVHLFRGH